MPVAGLEFPLWTRSRDIPIFHADANYGRDRDLPAGTHNWLDLTPLGRHEGWGGVWDLNQEGKDWTRRHSKYDDGKHDSRESH